MTTGQQIIALLPLAEKMVFHIGGKIVEIMVDGINTSEDLIKELEDSKSDSWPKYSFKSGQ